MICDSENVLAIQERLKQQNPDRLVAIRIEATPAVKQRVLALARDGAEVIHLVFDAHGRERLARGPRPGRSPGGEGTGRAPPCPRRACGKSIARW